MGEDEFTSMLNKFTDDELEGELARRRQPPEPLPLDRIDLTLLQREAKSYLKNINENNRPSKNAEHHLFENVMTTLYGPDIFNWICELQHRMRLEHDKIGTNK